MKVTAVEPGPRITLPAEWAAELGFDHLVSLEKTAEGIVIRPCRRASWDDIFAAKLTVGPVTAFVPEDVEVSGDDLLF